MTARLVSAFAAGLMAQLAWDQVTAGRHGMAVVSVLIGAGNCYNAWTGWWEKETP